MSDYITVKDLREVLGYEMLHTLSGTLEEGDVDESVTNRAIAAAQSEVDSYLGRRYALPLVEVPGVLRTVTIDVAVYHLARGLDLTSEDIERRYAGALRWLRRLVEGQVGLQPEAPAPAARRSAAEGEPRRFTRRSLRHW